MLDYGIRLGLAGATAAAIGFLLNLDHVGWACAAALLVMRPAAEMQRLRSVGRVISVAVGALVAIVLVRLGPPSVLYSLGAIAAIAAAGAMRRSRWYVVPAFTRFLVFCSCSTPTPGTLPRASASACSRRCSAWVSPTCSASYCLH